MRKEYNPDISDLDRQIAIQALCEFPVLSYSHIGQVYNVSRTTICRWRDYTPEHKHPHKKPFSKYELEMYLPFIEICSPRLSATVGMLLKGGNLE